MTRNEALINATIAAMQAIMTSQPVTWTTKKVADIAFEKAKAVIDKLDAENVFEPLSIEISHNGEVKVAAYEEIKLPPIKRAPPPELATHSHDVSQPNEISQDTPAEEKKSEEVTE